MRVHIKRGLQITGLLLLIFAAFAYRGARAQAQIGAGYIAHQLCSCVFVAERSIESCRPDMLPVMDRIQAEIIDVDGKKGVRGWIPLFAERRALHSEGRGCALD